MGRATWLAAVLRKAGCKVVEMDGWQTRETRSGFEPQGIVWHHTATGPNVTNEAVRRLLRDGRSDLPGPLCHLGLERDGTFVVVAAGRANHAGYGKPWGNDSIGIEAYNNGVGEPWPKVQLDAYEIGTAAVLTALGLGAPQVKAHREVDPDRKIDPTGIDMNQARARIADLLAPGLPVAPMEADVFTANSPGTNTMYLFEQDRFTKVPDADHDNVAKIPAFGKVTDGFWKRLIKGRTEYSS